MNTVDLTSYHSLNKVDITYRYPITAVATCLAGASDAQPLHLSLSTAAAVPRIVDDCCATRASAEVRNT